MPRRPLTRPAGHLRRSVHATASINARPVDVARLVSAGRLRHRHGVQPQRVTDVIEPEAVGELRADQRHATTPRTRGGGLFIHLGLACNHGHQKFGNEIANLA